MIGTSGAPIGDQIWHLSHDNDGRVFRVSRNGKSLRPRWLVVRTYMKTWKPTAAGVISVLCGAFTVFTDRGGFSVGLELAGSQSGRFEHCIRCRRRRRRRVCHQEAGVAVGCRRRRLCNLPRPPLGHRDGHATLGSTSRGIARYIEERILRQRDPRTSELTRRRRCEDCPQPHRERVGYLSQEFFLHESGIMSLNSLDRAEIRFSLPDPEVRLPSMGREFSERIDGRHWASAN
jgi:hypothetical protein